MAAYVIADVNITDPEAYAEYRKLVPGTLEKFGGRFVARGGQVTPLEGGWQPERIVILEFESAEQARRWYDSEEYSYAKSLRQQASNGRLILVEGV